MLNVKEIRVLPLFLRVWIVRLRSIGKGRWRSERMFDAQADSFLYLR